MDICNITPNELRGLSADDLENELKRVSPEQRQRLTQEQVAAVMEVLHPAFQLTTEEQERRDAALLLADPDTWRAITASCLQLIVESYDDGEVTLTDSVEAVGRIAIACRPQNRIQLIGMMAALLLKQPARPRGIGERRPAYPTWMRRGTAELILLLQEREPEKRLTPGVESRNAYDPSSPLIDKALQILTTLKWFGERPLPRPGTIDDWVRERRRERETQMDQTSV